MSFSDTSIPNSLYDWLNKQNSLDVPPPTRPGSMRSLAFSEVNTLILWSVSGV